MIAHLVFLLEEQSAQDFLESLLARFPVVGFETHYIVFEGKQDLEKRLERKLKLWIRPNTQFVVMRDQDAGDCKVIKDRLRAICAVSGRDDAIVRIACRELESFFVGDWQAIAAGFNKPNLSAHDRKAKFRDPDKLSNPAREIQRLVPFYQKRDGARRVAPHLEPSRNRSESFRVLFSTLATIFSSASIEASRHGVDTG